MAVPLTVDPQTRLNPVTENETETGEPIMAHIVKADAGKSAAAMILEARINGTPVEALCGHVWIPQRDPGKYPLCQACKEVYEMYRVFNNHLDERPAE
jgi:hypothetical protein